jgi:exodeoxyribonuclease VII small subunit
MAKCITVEQLLTASDAPAQIEALTFEQALSILEELVASVESGTLSLDRSILSYERGVLLIAHLRKKLTGAEEKLRVLQRAKGPAQN